MRKGYYAKWVLDRKGEIFAISTGSDATSEHEWGSAPLMECMTGLAPLYAKSVAESILAGRSKKIPDLLAGRMICSELPEFVFDERKLSDGTPMAAIGCTARTHPLSNLAAHRELELSSYELSNGMFCSGAWDAHSFGFAVRGEREVAKLSRFYESVKAGNGIFAGLFLRDLSGVVICDVSKARPEHRTLMTAAQDLFAAAVRKHVAEERPDLVL